MKVLCGLLIICGFFLYPVESVEVGELRPMEVLVVSKSGNQVVIDGGDGLVGQGGTWHLAMSNLEESASGTPFFGTVKTVVLSDGDLVEDMLEDDRLRPGAAVYFGRGDAVELAAYFRDKSSGATIQALKSAQAGGLAVEIFTVQSAEGGYVFE